MGDVPAGDLNDGGKMTQWPWRGVLWLSMSLVSGRVAVGQAQAAPAEGRAASPGRPPIGTVIHRDTVALPPASVAITGYAGAGVVVELVGSDPRLATFLADTVGRAWIARSYDYLADASAGSASASATWSSAVDPFAGGQAQGLLLAYVEREGARGTAELSLTIYRRVFDAAVAVPVRADEAQRLLGRIGTALDAVAATLDTSRCSAPPEMRRPATPTVPANTAGKWANGELFATFFIGTDGRAPADSVRLLFASDRAFETSTRRLIERSRYAPGQRDGQSCPMFVVQPFEWVVEQPAKSASSRRSRIARRP